MGFNLGYCKMGVDTKSQKIMKKEINCSACEGTGKKTISICDECGKEGWVGEYEGREICQQCWFATLSDEEIADLV